MNYLKKKNEMYGESEGNQNFNFLIQSTSGSSSSTFTQASKDNNFKKRNKNGKKHKKI